MLDRQEKYNNQQARFFQKQYEAEPEREALTRHYEYLTKYANDIILMMDAGWKIVEANDRAVQAYGHTYEELLQMNIREVYNPEVIPYLSGWMEQVDTGNGLVYETVHHRKDGKIFPVEISARTMVVEGKKFYQAIIRDITERKHTEELLRDSEQKYRNIFENAAEGIFQSTPEGRYISVNPAFARIGGYDSPDEMISTVTDIQRQMYVHQASRTRLIELLKNQAVVNNFEAEVRRRDGSIIWISMNVSPAMDKSGKIVLLDGTIVDITARKRAEEALQISETRYRRLFESALDGIFIIDADTGLIIDANPFMQDLLGYSCEEFVGKRLWDIGPFKDIAATKSSFDELKRKKYIRYEDLPVETSDGRLINVEFISFVYMVDSKDIIQCNIRDITERKRAESELNEQIAELQRWHNATLGREGRILELKAEVNELLARAGEPPRYPSAESQDKKEK